MDYEYRSWKAEVWFMTIIRMRLICAFTLCSLENILNKEREDIARF